MKHCKICAKRVIRKRYVIETDVLCKEHFRGFARYLADVIVAGRNAKNKGAST